MVSLRGVEFLNVPSPGALLGSWQANGTGPKSSYAMLQRMIADLGLEVGPRDRQLSDDR